MFLGKPSLKKITGKWLSIGTPPFFTQFFFLQNDSEWLKMDFKLLEVLSHFCGSTPAKVVQHIVFLIREYSRRPQVKN